MWSTLAFLGVGLVITLIAQSSTVSTALILSLSATTDLPIISAAAAIIGANIGSTITAIYGAMGATANAKRAASAHILFNVTAGIVSFALLPFLVQFLDIFIEFFKMDSSDATKLALFHTLFNVLGVLLMIPLAKYIAQFLEKCFTKDDILIEKPKYLDDNLLSMPPLAIEALSKELDRFRDLLITSVRGFVSYLHEE